MLTVLAPPDDDKRSVRNKRAKSKARSEILKDAETILESAITPLRRNPNLNIVRQEVCEGLCGRDNFAFC